jgi:multidrug efflux system outer membrane protein
LLSLPIFDGADASPACKAQPRNETLWLRVIEGRCWSRFAKSKISSRPAWWLLSDQAMAQAAAVESASRATVLSTSRYRNGDVSQLELLDARCSELANRRLALQVRSEQYQATVR